MKMMSRISVLPGSALSKKSGYAMTMPLDDDMFGHAMMIGKRIVAPLCTVASYKGSVRD